MSRSNVSCFTATTPVSYDYLRSLALPQRRRKLQVGSVEQSTIHFSTCIKSQLLINHGTVQVSITNSTAEPKQAVKETSPNPKTDRNSPDMAAPTPLMTELLVTPTTKHPTHHHHLDMAVEVEMTKDTDKM